MGSKYTKENTNKLIETTVFPTKWAACHYQVKHAAHKCHYSVLLKSAFNGSLRPSFDKLIIRSFQHICMCLVCVLRSQAEFCLKYGDYSSIAAWATSITL